MGRPSVLLGALGAASIVAAAGASGALATPLIATASNYAGYTGSEIAKRVSATVTVPTVDCSAVAGSGYAGQSIGVHLDSGGLQVMSDVRTYCRGATPVYTVEQALPVAGADQFSPSTISIAPGDRVKLVVSTGGGGTLASAVVTSGGSSQGTAASGPDPLPNAVPYLLVTTIAATAKGTPLRTGAAPAGNPVLAGPVASTPVRVSGAKVNGLPLGQVNELKAVQWVDSGNRPLVTPGALGAAGTGFSFRVTT